MTSSLAANDPGAGPAVPDGGRRAVTLIAVGAILLMTPSLWAAATAVAPATQHDFSASPRLHAVMVVVAVLCTAVLLVLGVLAGVVRADRLLGRIDAAVLAVGAAVLTGMTLLLTGISDESALTNRAATAFLRGEPVYGVEWRSLFADGRIALTPTMAGSADYTFGYPPGSVLLIAGFRAVLGHAAAAPAVVGAGALIVAIVAAWALTPARWRSLVTLAGLGTAMLPADARAGYPAVIALALLVPAIASWHRTGAGGRLGRAGLLRAAALGGACAVHQTAWFVAAFLVVGVWALRRTEVGRLRALLVAGRYTLAALAVWAVVDLPFAILQPVAWLEGLFLPLTQHAIVHGQGVVAIVEFLLPGSGAIGWLSYAQLALLIGLLALLALFPHRLAVVLPVLPGLPYVLGTRSSADYFVLFLPLWVLAATTVPTTIAAPWSRLRRRGRAILAAALLAPALLCTVVALGTPSPLQVRVEATTRTAAGIGTATVLIANTGGSPIRPHFLSRVGTHPSFWWRVRSGPAVVEPGRSVRYVIEPEASGTARLVAASGSKAVLMTLSDAPQTLTTVPFPG